MRSVWLILAVAFSAASLPAQAQDEQRRAWPSESQSWLPQIPDCTCRAHGRDYRTGEVVCIRDRLATCNMVLNNTNWAMSDAPCTVSALPGNQL